MKQTHYVFSLLAAALFASCSSNGSYGHAMVHTKAAPAPVVAVPARPAPLPPVRQAAPAPVQPKAVQPLAAQPNAAAPVPVAPPAARVAPLPPSNARMQTRDYPVMPGQNRGLKRIRSCAY